MKNLVNQNLDEFLREGCKVPKTKKAKQEKFEDVLHKWGKGKLKSGEGKRGKVPKTPKGQKQALAIAFSETGQSKNK